MSTALADNELAVSNLSGVKTKELRAIYNLFFFLAAPFVLFPS